VEAQEHDPQHLRACFGSSLLPPHVKLKAETRVQVTGSQVPVVLKLYVFTLAVFLDLSWRAIAVRTFSGIDFVRF
jgi:hypothetical protein